MTELLNDFGDVALANAACPNAGDLVCLHASASSSRQWRPLINRLAGRREVHAFDLYGSGAAAPWSSLQPMRLRDEATRLAPLLYHADQPVHLVGHSYGGAVALKTALCFPQRVASLVLYEPMWLSVLLDEDPYQSAALEILQVRRQMDAWIRAGDHHSAAERFVNYWSGIGSWDALSAVQQASIALSMPSVAAHWDAIVAEPTPATMLSVLSIPVLLIVGSRSPAASVGIARIARQHLRYVNFVSLDGAGHMGPITHPTEVNELIERHLGISSRF